MKKIKLPERKKNVKVRLGCLGIQDWTQTDRSNLTQVRRNSFTRRRVERTPCKLFILKKIHTIYFNNFSKKEEKLPLNVIEFKKNDFL